MKLLLLKNLTASLLVIIFIFFVNFQVYAEIVLSNKINFKQTSLSNKNLQIAQLAKIVASNPGEGRYQQLPLGGRDLIDGDLFSYSLAVFEDTLVVGAPGEDSSAVGINGDESDNSSLDSGAVYIFKNIDGQWQQKFYLKGSDLNPNDRFGSAVAISNKFLAILSGTSGNVYIFEKSQDQWHQRTIIQIDKAQFNRFDFNLAFEGNTLVIGAPANSSPSVMNESDNSLQASGAVYVYKITSDEIEKIAFIKAPIPQMQARFGSSVAISGDKIVVGAPIALNSTDENMSYTGSVYVYDFINGVVSFSNELKPSLHFSLPNSFVPIQFGYSLAIEDNTLLVGAVDESVLIDGINIEGAGVVHVYELNSISKKWIETSQLIASHPERYDGFAESIALRHNTIVVSALREDGFSTGINGNQEDNTATDSGAVYVFQKDYTQWKQVAYVKSEQPSIPVVVTGDGAVSPDGFGNAVVLTDKYLVIGSSNENLASGSSRIFSTNFMPLNKTHTGLWYDPNEPFHAISFYLLDDNRVVVIWFTYDNQGQQMWLVGVGKHDGYTATLGVSTRYGGSFPPVNSNAQVNNWGKFKINFNNCNRGYFKWFPNADTGYSVGSTQISRLTNTSGLACNESESENTQSYNSASSVDDSKSSLWFNSEGEFLMNTYMLDDNKIVHMWYTFDNNNNPIWLQGIGTRDGTKAVLDAYIFSGGQFPPNYNNDNVRIDKWGTFELEYSDCNNGLFKWNPLKGNGFSSGETIINRLTNTKGLKCNN